MLRQLETGDIDIWLQPEPRIQANKSQRSASFLAEVLRHYPGPTAAIQNGDQLQTLLTRTPAGKPLLRDNPDHLQFNLSHSHGLIACAVSYGQQIGLDIDFWRRRNRYLAIAQRYFHPSEFQQLQQLSGTAQQQYFYRLWTLKEAWLKAEGSGLAGGLQALEFQVQEQRIHCNTAEASADNVLIAQWQPTEDFFAAVVTTACSIPSRWRIRLIKQHSTAQTIAGCAQNRACSWQQLNLSAQSSVF